MKPPVPIFGSKEQAEIAVEALEWKRDRTAKAITVTNAWKESIEFYGLKFPFGILTAD